MSTRLQAVGGLVVAVIASLTLTTGEVGASASASIKPHQHFIGVVGSPQPAAASVPVVTVGCPSPVSTTSTGPITAYQSLAVERAAKGPGYTGLFSQIYAWFAQDSSAHGPQQVKFVKYNTKVEAPTTVRLPCGGTGQVVFSSCPHLAPCAAGWVATAVTVRFKPVQVVPVVVLPPHP